MAEAVALDIALRDRHVGVLEVRGGFSRFYFTDDYLTDPDRAVLGLRFEQNVHAAYTGQDGLPSWFANLLPEGSLRQLIDAELAIELGRSATDLDVLLRVGSDLPGAVTATLREASSSARRRYPVISTTGSPQALGTRLEFSIAGVGLKFSVLRQDDKFVAPAREADGDWLVKLPDPMFRMLPVNEFASMRLAGRVGISVPEVKLVVRDELQSIPERFWRTEAQALVVRRFDRTPNGRVHMEDFAQVRGFDVDQRYNGTFETLGNLIWRRIHTDDLIEFVRRLVLNFLIGNDDAHLKNWSLLYEDPRVGRLSPVYDVVSVEAYPRTGLDRGTGLRIANSKRYEDLTLGAFGRLARKIGFDEEVILEVVRETVSNVNQEWDQYCVELKDPEFVRRVTLHRERISDSLRATPDS